MTSVDRLGSSRAACLLTDSTASSPADSACDELKRRPGAAPLDSVGKMLEGATSLNMLFVLQVSAREANRAMGESAIYDKKHQIENARKQIDEAMKKAQEESNSASGWGKWTSVLSTVAKVATVAAAAASIVVTGGASAPVLLALGGMFLSMMAKPLAKATGIGDTGEKILNYTGMAASLAGGGIGAFSGASATANAASQTAQTAARAGQVGQVVSGSATAASGVTTGVQGYHQSESLEARADEVSQRAQQKAMMRQMEVLIELLKEADKSVGRTKETLTKTMNLQAQGSLALATMGVRA